jgi:hypothetical protein
VLLLLETVVVVVGGAGMAAAAVASAAVAAAGVVCLLLAVSPTQHRWVWGVKRNGTCTQVGVGSQKERDMHTGALTNQQDAVALHVHTEAHRCIADTHIHSHAHPSTQLQTGPHACCPLSACSGDSVPAAFVSFCICVTLV